MAKNAVYIFAHYPNSFAMSAGLLEIIREVKPDLPVHLVCAAEPRTISYQWGNFADRFDSVQWVSTAMYGPWNHRFNMRGLGWAFTRGFPTAHQTRAEMRKLRFEPNAVAFAFAGTNLLDGIFLRRIRAEPSLSSVLITEQTDDALLTDFSVGYWESFYLNLFQQFYGTAYLDLYWMRVPGGGRSSQREYRFRNNPADYLFFGEHAFRRRTLNPGQTYLPYYRKDQSHPGSNHSVIVFGGMFYWEPLISLEPFHRQFNKFLQLIRMKHKGQRLLYLPHPALPFEEDNEIKHLDLSGFEILRGISSEALITRDRSITKSYAVSSTSLFTTACLGVKPHFLYRLFDEESIPESLKVRLDRRLTLEVHDEMRPHSVEQWMNGQSDYTLVSSSDRVRAATVKMLEIVGILDSKEATAIHGGITLTVENRWLIPPRPWSLVGFIRAVIGIPATYCIRNRIARALGDPAQLISRAVRKLWRG